MNDIRFHPESTADKTGKIPVSYVGKDRQDSIDSCIKANCLMLSDKHLPGAREYILDLALQQVDQAASRGWRAAVVLPRAFDGRTLKTPGGETIQVCPAVLHHHVNCNDCRQCGGLQSPGPHIGFPDHGRTVDRPSCYSQSGSPALAHASMIRAEERGKPYDLEAALAGRRVDAKAFRMCAIGNAWPHIPKQRLLPILERIRAEGLRVLMYDHWAWKMPAGQWLKDWAMASVDGLRRKR